MRTQRSRSCPRAAGGYCSALADPIRFSGQGVRLCLGATSFSDTPTLPTSSHIRDSRLNRASRLGLELSDQHTISGAEEGGALLTGADPARAEFLRGQHPAEVRSRKYGA